MIKEKMISNEGYDFLPEEKLLLRNTSVKHGLLSAFTNNLLKLPIAKMGCTP